MEDEDFTIDNEGQIDLRYRGWKEVNAMTFTFANQLAVLDLSFNQLQTLPDEIGTLMMLKTLNCACNILESIPSAIGRLTRLKWLKLNGNRLKMLPDEISDCRRLSVLCLSENQIDRLPESLSCCTSLTDLHVENNMLTYLPLGLANIKDTLLVINVKNNPMLLTIPAEMHDNAKVIMWIVCFLLEQKTLVDTIQLSSSGMSSLSNLNKTIIEERRKQIHDLEEEAKILNEERESTRFFLRFRELSRKGKAKLNEFRSFAMTMISRESKIAIQVMPEEEE